MGRKLKAKKPTEVWAYEHAKSVHGSCWSADGATLASCSYDDTVGFHDVDKDKTTSVRHDNRTGRYLTPFKPTMDPHAPFPAVIMGSWAGRAAWTCSGPRRRTRSSSSTTATTSSTRSRRSTTSTPTRTSSPARTTAAGSRSGAPEPLSTNLNVV